MAGRSITFSLLLIDAAMWTYVMALPVRVLG
jgi:hypothetical protein